MEEIVFTRSNMVARKAVVRATFYCKKMDAHIYSCKAVICYGSYGLHPYCKPVAGGPDGMGTVEIIPTTPDIYKVHGRNQHRLNKNSGMRYLQHGFHQTDLICFKCGNRDSGDLSLSPHIRVYHVA